MSSDSAASAVSAASAGDSAAGVRRNEFGQPIGKPVDYSGARPPGPVTLTGATCTLEPLTTAHAGELLPSLQAAAGDEQWTYMGFGPCADEGEFAAVIASLVDDPGMVPFAIRVGDGSVAGMASLMRIAPAGGTIEVGTIMYGAGLRRTTAATEAMYLLARHVVEDLGYRRYEWKCDALNEPSRRAGQRLGFTFEGVWRNALVYKGRNRDTAWFAMTDDDWARLRPGYEAWLAQADGPDARGLRSFLTP